MGFRLKVFEKKENNKIKIDELNFGNINIPVLERFPSFLPSEFTREDLENLLNKPPNNLEKNQLVDLSDVGKKIFTVAFDEGKILKQIIEQLLSQYSNNIYFQVIGR